MNKKSNPEGISIQSTNIRAAMVLGGEIVGVEGVRGLAIWYFNFETIIPFSLLQFTSSRDWAWLLVEKALKKGSSDLFCALYKIKPFEMQFTEPNEPNYTSESEWYITSWLLTFSPEQICLAALEVLENEK